MSYKDIYFFSFLALKRTLIFYVFVINYIIGASRTVNNKIILSIVLITGGALLMGVKLINKKIIIFILEFVISTMIWQEI